MKPSYRATNLGQALQQVSIFRDTDTILGTIKKHWTNIVPEFMHNMSVNRYVEQTGSLYIDTHVPIIYIQQYTKNVQGLCNAFFGSEVIKKIKFVYKRL